MKAGIESSLAVKCEDSLALRGLWKWKYGNCADSSAMTPAISCSRLYSRLRYLHRAALGIEHFGRASFSLRYSHGSHEVCSLFRFVCLIQTSTIIRMQIITTFRICQNRREGSVHVYEYQQKMSESGTDISIKNASDECLTLGEELASIPCSASLKITPSPTKIHLGDALTRPLLALSTISSR